MFDLICIQAEGNSVDVRDKRDEYLSPEDMNLIDIVCESDFSRKSITRHEKR